MIHKNSQTTFREIQNLSNLFLPTWGLLQFVLIIFIYYLELNNDFKCFIQASRSLKRVLRVGGSSFHTQI